MQLYLVGGAVRDKLLDLPVKDKDFVVVGSTIDEMLALGFTYVGKDFPVFLHPITGHEFALARTERKNGKGYNGFEITATKEITLEQDLERRDLTINAMAIKVPTCETLKFGTNPAIKTLKKDIIDPFNGLKDLEEKKLRHIGNHFADDPVRVLRTSRFRARYAYLGFDIANETIDLMAELVNKGELNHLTKERVWMETWKALHERNPNLYFRSLKECQALQVLFPEIERLFGIPQVTEYHPEIDTGVHTMMVLQQACKLSEESTRISHSDEPMIRWAALLHDLGKGVTPEDEWPKHHEHETLGLPLVEAVCNRWKVPTKYKKLALLVCEHHLRMHKLFELRTGSILKLLEKLDAFRNPEILEPFILACEADARGRRGLENREYSQSDFLRKMYQAAKEVKAEPFLERYKGEEIGFQVRQARIKAMQKVQIKKVKEKVI